MFFSPHPGLTIVPVLDTRRPSKTGDYYVRIRVTFRREQVYYNTGVVLSKDDWANMQLEKSSQNWKQLTADQRRYLTVMKTKIKESFDKIDLVITDIQKNSEFTFQALNVKLSKAPGDTINSKMKANIEMLEKEGRAGSQIYYQCALNSIEKFAGQNIPLTGINVEWLKRYEKYLLKGTEEKKGLSYTTVGMYMRAIRTILNSAKTDGTIKEIDYPFGRDRYEIQTGEGRKLALSLQQIKAVVTYADAIPSTEKFRDLWFFSYLTGGMNFTDLIRLKYSDISNGEISYYRAKTFRTSKVKKKIVALLTPEAEKIINTWGNPDRKPDKYIFPFLKGNETPMQEKVVARDLISQTNSRLKKIGAALGIDNLSTYSARHSFATVLKHSGANIAYISESLGHSDQKVTEHYLASFEKDARIKNTALLTNFDKDDTNI